MANYTVSGSPVGVKLDSAPYADVLANGQINVASSTDTLLVIESGADKLQVFGTGLSSAPSGTVSALFFFFDGANTPDITITDLNVDWPTLSAAETTLSGYHSVLLGGDDLFLGGNFDDKLIGQDGNDELFGNAGRDILDGSDGDDLINGGAGGDRLIGGAGNDRIDGGPGNDLLFGNDGNDRFFFSISDGDDTLDGGAGFDILDFSSVAGAVQVDLTDGTTSGSAGNDTLVGVFEQVIGTNFGDVLSGNHGINILDGNGGDDRIYGNGGDDLLRGGDGDDTFYFQLLDGDDRLLGGNGFDVLNFSGVTGVIQVNQLAGTTSGSAGKDILLDVFEQVVGSEFNDVLSGGHGINSLKGLGGDDQIFGNNGDDWINGGPGTDIIVLGVGDDVFQFFDGDGSDTVKDFTAGAGTVDKINFKTASAATSFAQMQATPDMITQVDADTVINLGGDDKITLLGVNMADLHADDFIF